MMLASAYTLWIKVQHKKQHTSGWKDDLEQQCKQAAITLSQSGGSIFEQITQTTRQTSLAEISKNQRLHKSRFTNNHATNR